MKKFIVVIDPPVKNGFASLNNGEIVCMVAYGNKYVMSFSGGEVSMVNGQDSWNGWAKVGDMIEELEKDERVQLYCFDSFQKLAKWLLEK